MPLDLHVLSLPLAFILSQDQTLRCYCFFSFFSLSVPAACFFEGLYLTETSCVVPFPFVFVLVSFYAAPTVVFTVVSCGNLVIVLFAAGPGYHPLPFRQRLQNYYIPNPIANIFATSSLSEYETTLNNPINQLNKNMLIFIAIC